MRISRKHLLSLAATGVVAMAASVQAASITTWTTGTFSDNSILPSAALVLYAVDTGGFGATADGITFIKQRRYDDPSNPPGNGAITMREWNQNDNQLGGRTTGDAAFDMVLNTGYNTQNESVTCQITLLNLILGTTYDVLLLNARNTSGSMTMQGGDSATGDNGTLNGNSSLAQQYNFTSGPIGAYVKGRFTADATSQVLWLHTVNGETGQLNAVVVSAVPEPASLGVFAIGALALLARRRRV